MISCCSYEQVGLKMFLGVTANVGNWNVEGTMCSLILEDNPLVDFVELPDTCQGLYYCNILSGVIRGALEMVSLPPSIASANYQFLLQVGSHNLHALITSLSHSHWEEETSYWSRHTMSSIIVQSCDFILLKWWILFKWKGVFLNRNVMSYVTFVCFTLAFKVAIQQYMVFLVYFIPY